MKADSSLVKTAVRLLDNRILCLVAWVVGVVYITVYGFLKNPIEYTASMIGLDYPVAFIFWGILSSIALFLNIRLMYRRYRIRNRIGYICMALGSVCIMTTVFIPSTEEMGLQLIAHWGTALLFAVFFAAAIILFLILLARKKDRASLITLIAFALILILMLALLGVFGKNGLIESLPMWAAYLILFLYNYTPVYRTALHNSRTESDAATESEKQ